MKNIELFVCGRYFYEVLIGNATKLQQTKPSLFNKRKPLYGQYASYKHLLDISIEAKNNLLDLKYEPTMLAASLYDELQRGLDIFIEMIECLLKATDQYGAGKQAEAQVLAMAYHRNCSELERHLDVMLPVFNAFLEELGDSLQEELVP